MAKRASIFNILVLATLLAAVAVFLLPPAPTPAPAVTFTLLDGTQLPLAELRGRPVLVSFWATSCPPCVEELPELIRLYRDLGPGGLEMIAVAMPYDPPIQVRDFRNRFELPYRVALDAEGRVTAAFGDVSLIPAAFLIDPEGDIVYQQVGKLDTARVRRLVSRFADTRVPED